MYYWCDNNQAYSLLIIERLFFWTLLAENQKYVRFVLIIMLDLESSDLSREILIVFSGLEMQPLEKKSLVFFLPLNYCVQACSILGKCMKKCLLLLSHRCRKDFLNLFVCLENHLIFFRLEKLFFKIFMAVNIVQILRYIECVSIRACLKLHSKVPLPQYQVLIKSCLMLSAAIYMYKLHFYFHKTEYSNII